MRLPQEADFTDWATQRSIFFLSCTLIFLFLLGEDQIFLGKFLQFLI